MNNTLQTSEILWLFAGLVLLLMIVFVIGYLKGMKKANENKKISLKLQRSVLGGMFSEQIAPYLPGWPSDLNPSEAKFIGKPVDFIIFKGMDNHAIDEVIFVEVKSGNSRLNSQERGLRDAIQQKRVQWREWRVEREMTDLPS